MEMAMTMAEMETKTMAKGMGTMGHETAKRTTRILVADENSEVRKNCADALGRMDDCVVDTAKNGEEAAHMILSGNYDVVVADLWLSGVDGVKLIRETADAPSHPAFVILAQMPSTNVYMEVNRAGAMLCLPKPVDYRALTAGVETICKKSCAGGREGTRTDDSGAAYRQGRAGHGSAGHAGDPPDRRSGAHQGVPVSAHGDPYDHRGQRHHQFGDEGAVSVRGEEVPDNDLPCGTRDPARH